MSSFNPKSSPAVRMTFALLKRFVPRLNWPAFRLNAWDGSSDVIGQGQPAFEISVRDWRAIWRILRAPDPGFGDAYIDSQLDVNSLPHLLDAYLTGSASAPAMLGLLRLPFRHTSVSQQYHDIQSHYDRGNAFFKLWLDQSMSYSCAYFRHPSDSLEEAQSAKVQYVLRKAHLAPGQRLLDVGSGWGALILEAARRYGVRAHGITLSREQLDFTREAIHREGLQDRVTVELMDYRELAAQSRRFDRVVSVGMMEHVGQKNLPAFFKSIQGLLTPGGVCVLHSMTRLRERPVSRYIRRHIFPGCYVPSWREVVQLLPEFDFHLIDGESLRRHYAMTLHRWAARFEDRLNRIRALGFDERFIRMWRLYLHACAASFRHGVLDLHQWIFTRGVNNDLSLTRHHQLVENGAAPVFDLATITAGTDRSGVYRRKEDYSWLNPH